MRVFGAHVHSWVKHQKHAKNLIQEIREIDGSYLCLQRFDKFWMWSTGNRKRKLWKFSKTWMENLVKSHQRHLLLAGFSCLEPLCAGFAAAQTWENFWTLMHSYLQTRNGWVCAFIFMQAVTVSTDELLCDKNARACVSMVSYLKKNK